MSDADHVTPFMIVSRALDFGFSLEKVYVAICLIDHLVMGVGCSRQEALDMMIIEVHAKYPDGIMKGIDLDA